MIETERVEQRSFCSLRRAIGCRQLPHAEAPIPFLENRLPAQLIASVEHGQCHHRREHHRSSTFLGSSPTSNGSFSVQIRVHQCQPFSISLSGWPGRL